MCFNRIKNENTGLNEHSLLLKLSGKWTSKVTCGKSRSPTQWQEAERDIRWPTYWKLKGEVERGEQWLPNLDEDRTLRLVSQCTGQNLRTFGEMLVRPWSRPGVGQTMVHRPSPVCPSLVNKVLLKHGPTHLFMFFYVCFPTTIAQLSSYKTDRLASRD